MQDKEISSSKKGHNGEEKATIFLESRGYCIICKNYRTKRGEIDIIALKDNTLVFAEVKTAPHGTVETLECLLGQKKQKRIVETAKRFLLEYRKYSKSYIRFDVLIVDSPFFEPVYHIENAFSEIV